jgi:hypothetical protein
MTAALYARRGPSSGAAWGNAAAPMRLVLY